jgi:hypothetical protein
MPAHPITRWAVLLAPLLPLLVALVVWAPLLDNYFQHDDFFHLYDIATLGFARFVTTTQVGHLYLLPNAVFYATFRAFGPDPRPYFWCELLTHLVNVLLLYYVVRRLTGDRALACIGALLWGTTPALEGALGWYAVYGQVLLTTIVLVLLASLASLLEEGHPLSLCGAVWWGWLLIAGAASFGTGLGITIAFPFVVLLAVPASQRSRGSVALVTLAPILTSALYAILSSISPPFPAVFAEALRARAMITAIPDALVLGVHLLAFGATTLLLGFVGLDHGYPNVAAVGAAGGVLLVVALAYHRSDVTTRRRLLALALLLASACGAIALGRASLVEFYHLAMSGAATWIRYHYLPTAILAVLLCSALATLRDESLLARRVVYGTGWLWVAARLLLLVMRPLPIAHHEHERAATEAALQSIAAAVAGTPPGETIYIENRFFPPAGVVNAMAPGIFPGWAALFTIFFPENTVDGRPVRFLVSEEDWKRAHERGGRMAALVARNSTP